MINTWIILVLLGQTTSVIPKSFSDGMPEVAVISTSTPKYPPLAVATLTKGVVLLDIAISSDGKVLVAKAVEGHPLLRNSAELAAALWRFQTATSSTGNRRVRLTFVFDIVFAESTETKDEGLFIPPVRFEVTRKIATIAALGRRSEDNCTLHGEELRLDTVPMVYGLPAAEARFNNVDLVSIFRNGWKKLSHGESYFEAERVRFPNSHTHAYGGCMVGYETKAEVLYCQRCRKAEAKWRKAHGNRGPEMAAVISGGNSK